MYINHRHDWTLTPEQAIKLQKELVSEVIYDHPLDLSKITRVAGVDVSVKDNVSQAAVVIASFPDLKVIETARWQMPTPFPYIPGLLSFREGPVLEEAFKKIENVPDVLIFDGMGRAHPRRFGIACHMGLLLEKPTIGCGKTLFVGKYVEPPDVRGEFAPLIDKGETIGDILRTRAGTKPVFISVGHLADLQTAVELVMRCTGKYRLPEPIRMAHNAAGEFHQNDE